jgi:Ca-activated chloride channel family protein
MKTFPLLAACAAIGCGSQDGAPPPAPERSGSASASAEAAPPAGPRPAPGADLVGPIPLPVPLPDRGVPSPGGAAKAPLDLMADRALVRVDVPRPPLGGAVALDLGGERRGWVASLPEPQQLPALAYGDDRVYVSGGFRSISFYALHATTGRAAWATTGLEDNGPTAAVFEDDRVIFNTESCTIFALDARTGRRLWRRYLGDPTLGQVALADGLVFAVHPTPDGHALSALRVTDGAPAWSGWIGSEVIAAPVVAGDSVYASTIHGLTFRFERRTGKLRWSRPLAATTAPWIDGDELFVTRYRGGKEQQIVVALDTGRIVREHQLSSGAYAGELGGQDAEVVWAFEGSRPVVLRGVRYVAMGAEVHASDARTGEELWRRRYPGPVDRRALGAVAVAGPAVAFATRDGKLFGLDADTGATLWSFDLGVPIVAQPIIARGWIYASTTDGRVVALEVADPTLDGWHMFGGNPRHDGPVAPPPPPPRSREG